MLADAAPGKGGRAGIGDVVITGGGGDSVEAELLGDLKLFHIFLHVFPAHQLRHLGKGTVAGHRQSPLQVAASMGRLTGDGLLAVGILAGAVEGFAFYPRHAFQGRGAGDNFVNGAGGIGGLEKPVQVHTGVGAGGVPLDVRHIVRVVGGGGDGTKDLTGFVIVHRHGALPAQQSVQGRVLHPGRQGQLFHAPGAIGIVYAVHQVVAHHGAGIFGHGPGTDKAAAVAHPMEGGFSGLDIGGVLPPVGQVQQGVPPPVHHDTAAQVAVVIYMGRPGGNYPGGSLGQVFKQEKSHSSQQNRQEQTHQPGSFGNTIHFLRTFLLSFTAKLAFCRVSAAFTKASSPQEATMLVPPLETKGKVTPVKGRMSTVPSTFRMV